jgi:phage-related tail protein
MVPASRTGQAQQILADKWKPIQSDMAELGLNARDNWASVVTVFADLVGLADKLYALLKQIPDAFAAIGSSSIWTRLTEISGSLGLNSDPASMGLETGIDVQRLDATNRLRAAMLNPANTRRAMQETTSVQDSVRGDTSKAPSAKADQTDAVDRGINSLRRHTEQQEADTQAVGLGQAALAKFRAEAQETSAVQANGGKETAEQAAQFKTLEDRAGAAADALAKAKVNSQISFGKQTAFLDPEDVQIASQLRTVYGDDVPKALGSSEAAALRLNNALKGTSDAFSSSINGPLLDFETGTRSAGDAMKQFEQQFIRSLLQMVNQALIVKPLLSGIGGFLGLGSVTGSGSVPVMSSGLGAGTGGLSFPMFAAGTDSAPGGLAWVGERGPELVNLPKGSQVIPNHVSTRLAIPGYADGGVIGGGSPAPIFGGQTTHISPTINVAVQGQPGASPADHAKMGENIAKTLQASIQGMIGDEIRKQGRPGGVLFARK